MSNLQLRGGDFYRLLPGSFMLNRIIQIYIVEYKFRSVRFFDLIALFKLYGVRFFLQNNLMTVASFVLLSSIFVSTICCLILWLVITDNHAKS